ncbi:kelch repeat-containing protein, partial [Rhizobium johnstonii]
QPNVNNLPKAAYEAANWVNDGKLYLLGGGDSSNSYNDFWEYDFVTNIFTRKNGLPTKLHSMAYAKDSNNNIWIFGGTYGEDSTGQVSAKNNNVWKYDYVT